MFATTYRRSVMTLFMVVSLVQIVVAQQPQEGVLLLKHGTTLRGFITPAGDRYIVLLGESGEARVPVADVAAVVSSLQEAYEYKRSMLDDHLASRTGLAQWCLQHELPARAADQLLAAERLFGRQPQLELLHQRLIASTKERASSVKPTEEGTTVAAASFEEAESSFPSHAVDSFTSSVQPLLLNRCAAGGCHNMRGTSDYVLFRPYLGQATTRRLTERNLTASLAYVDRTTPLESLLLSKATVPHGGAASAAIREREKKQLGILAQWVHSLRTRQRASTPTTIAPTNELLFQPSRMPRVDPDDPAAATSTARTPPEITEPIGDPFDPARFNQRHHGRTQ